MHHGFLAPRPYLCSTSLNPSRKGMRDNQKVDYIHKNALIANDQELAHWVMLQDDPAVMKSRAKSLRSLDPDTRINTLRNGMKLKYSQNPGLLARLQSTKGTIIAEANPHDTFWGIGKRVTDESAFEGKWDGSNIAGKLTMDVRDELCGSDSESTAGSVSDASNEDMDIQTNGGEEEGSQSVRL